MPYSSWRGGRDTARCSIGPALRSNLTESRHIQPLNAWLRRCSFRLPRRWFGENQKPQGIASWQLPSFFLKRRSNSFSGLVSLRVSDLLHFGYDQLQLFITRVEMR